MKKWHCLLLGSLASFTTFAKVPFTGVYMDVHAGTIQTDLKHHQISHFELLPLFNFIYENDNRATNMGGTGGFTLGYTYLVTNNFIVGLEGRINIDNIKTETRSTIYSSNNATAALLHSTIRLKNDFSLLFKFGSIWDCQTLFYGFIGPQCGKFQTFAGASFTQRNDPIFAKDDIETTTSHHRSAFTYGIGMEHLFWDCLSVALEVNHIDYESLRFPGRLQATFLTEGAIFPLVDVTTDNELHFKTTTALLKLTHYFS